MGINLLAMRLFIQLLIEGVRREILNLKISGVLCGHVKL